MRSYVRYKMYGFNHQIPGPGNTKEWCMTLKNNQKHLYKEHPFLYSVYIDDHITSITFELKEGLSCSEYWNELHQELEETTFRIITMFRGLPINQPVCELELAVDYNGNTCDAQLRDGIHVCDKLFIANEEDAEELYRIGTKTKTAYKEKEGVYKELFYILHSPHRVVQFLGLYDVLADLIKEAYRKNGKEISDVQRRVRDFFGKNKGKYDFVKFVESSKDKSKTEDSFTHLRNQIAHSRQAGVKQFIDISERITLACIQNMLTVINDILCEEVEI